MEKDKEVVEEEEEEEEIVIDPKERAFMIRRAIVMPFAIMSIAFLLFMIVYAVLSYKYIFEVNGPKTLALMIAVGIAAYNIVANLMVIYSVLRSHYFFVGFTALVMTAATLGMVFASLQYHWFWVIFTCDLIITPNEYMLAKDAFIFRGQPDILDLTTGLNDFSDLDQNDKKNHGTSNYIGLFKAV